MLCLPVFAQQILIDEGVQLAGLQCFPVRGDSTTYYYLPAVGAVSENEAGLPEVSYLRYIFGKATGNGTKSIAEAEGGAILHFLVTYTTPNEQVKEAEQQLKEIFGENAQLKGPVTLNEAKYTIISSILTESGEREKTVITTGEAPIFENSKLAFSFELSPQKSKMLLESFKMSTPDISIVFEFSFAGLSHDFAADLTVNWDDFYKSKQFGGDAKFYSFGADIEKGFEELRKNNTIKLEVIGGNTSMEKLLNTVYDKLLKLIFDPVKPKEIPKKDKGGLGDAILALIEGDVTKKFGLNVAYKKKKIKLTGESTMTFRGREMMERKHFITFNIGDLYQKHGDNKAIFKDVSLKDLSFLQRDVYVGVDGNLQEEFGQMINSVTVTLRKKHADGTVTIEEIVVNRHTLHPDSKFMMSYLNQGDDNLLNWRNYDYQTHWQFIGGGELKTEWTSSNAAMINLYVPYKREKIELIGNLNRPECDFARTVSVEIAYPFFGETKSENILIRNDENQSKTSFEVTLPNDADGVDYIITTFRKDGTQHSKSGTNTRVIFIDDACEQ